MRISHEKEYKKYNNKKINQGRNHLAIKYSFVWNIFNVFDSKFRQNRIENHRSDEIIYQWFYEFSYFSCNKQSDSDTDYIVLGKKGHEFFEHNSWWRSKTSIGVSDYSFFSSEIGEKKISREILKKSNYIICIFLHR